MANSERSKSTRFRPGQSGNPLGRPKKLPSLDRTIIEVLTSSPGKDETTVIEAIVWALAKKAMRGDTRAAEVMLDRAYGKSKVTVGITADSEIGLFLKMSPEEKEQHIKKLETDE